MRKNDLAPLKRVMGSHVFVFLESPEGIPIELMRVKVPIDDETWEKVGPRRYQTCLRIEFPRAQKELRVVGIAMSDELGRKLPITFPCFIGRDVPMDSCVVLDEGKLEIALGRDIERRFRSA